MSRYAPPTVTPVTPLPRFREDGAFIESSAASIPRSAPRSPAAAVSNVRFAMTGGGSHQPAPPHAMQTLVSWDRGRSYAPLWFDAAITGTPTPTLRAGTGALVRPDAQIP